MSHDMCLFESSGKGLLIALFGEASVSCYHFSFVLPVLKSDAGVQHTKRAVCQKGDRISLCLLTGCRSRCTSVTLQSSPLQDPQNVLRTSPESSLTLHTPMRMAWPACYHTWASKA